MSEPPDVSYVLATDTFETVREVVRHVREQTIAPRVELVLVCPSETALALDETEIEGIGLVTVLPVERFVPLADARAVGIRAARAPLVFVGETHSFPFPGCLETLVAAHGRGRFAVVAPVLENGNPARATSWANMMVTYRRWLEPAPRGPVDGVSTYNGCFRRELLLAYGEQLGPMLEYGSGLDRELVARGYGLELEPDARLSHLNVASLRATVPDRVLAARIWGAARARGWSRARRLAFAAGAPLIPLLTVARVLRSPQWSEHRGELPRWTIPALALSATCLAVGEALGYLRGAGDAAVRIATYELHRVRYA